MNSDIKESLKKSGGWLLTERLLRLINGIVIYAAIAKHLGPNDFGLLNVALGIIAILAALPGMGADSYNLSEIRRITEKQESFIGSAITVRLMFSTPSVAAIVFIYIVYPELGPYLVALSTLLIFSVLSIFQQKIQAEGNFSIFAKFSCTSILASSIIRAIGIVTDQPAIFFAWTAVIEGGIITTLTIKHSSGILYLISCIKNTTRKSIHSYVEICYPTALSAVLVSLYFKSEIILISKWIDPVAAGQWAVVMLVITPWSMIAAALLPIANNRLAALDPYGQAYKTKLAKLIKAFLLAGLAATIINIFLAKNILIWVLGNEYTNIEGAIIAASFSIIPVFMGALQDISIAHRKKTSIVLKKVLIGLPFSIISLYFLTSYFGLLGAGISITTSYFVTSILLNINLDNYFMNMTLNSLIPAQKNE